MIDHLDELVRTNLTRYAGGSMSLAAFEEWLIPATWTLEKSQHFPLSDLVSQIKLSLAEFSSGHWTEAELRERLTELLIKTSALQE